MCCLLILVSSYFYFQCIKEVKLPVYFFMNLPTDQQCLYDPTSLVNSLADKPRLRRSGGGVGYQNDGVRVREDFKETWFFDVVSMP